MKSSSISFLKIIKGDHKFSRTFFFYSKYHKFWLCHELFSVLCNILPPTRAVSSWNCCVLVNWVVTWVRTVSFCFPIFLATASPTTSVIYSLKIVIVFNYLGIDFVSFSIVTVVKSNLWCPVVVQLLKTGPHSEGIRKLFCKLF